MARFEVPEGSVVQAYRFALDPTPSQVGALASHAGAARFAHNHLLALVKAVWISGRPNAVTSPVLPPGARL